MAARSRAYTRLIVTSSTYRQAVRHDATAASKDADNRLLWRMNRGRLDAESVRDAILLVSGRLDDTMYGPPVKHFVTKATIHVTADVDYEHYDVDAPEARRRSVYRYIFRTRPDPLAGGGLDCPDSSQSAPVRSESLSALQALVLWNNKFVLRYSEHLAAQVETSSTEPAERHTSGIPACAGAAAEARRRRRRGGRIAASMGWRICVGCCSIVVSSCSSIDGTPHGRLIGWPRIATSPMM